MPHQFKHIIRLLLIVFLVISSTSCTRWREAKGVIVEADRLLEYGEIIEDTALLAATINTFNGPLGYVFARNDLLKAYYHMARNFYHAHDYATAADYYILCDRLKPSDPMYKGRVNSCMGFLCKQDSCFAEALEFYERANEAFVNDERRYANGLVSIAEQYVCLKEYAKADSVLQIASRFDVDSACYARMVDVRALALYNQRKYESALVCLLSIKDYVRPIDAKCHSYLKIMQSYAHLDKYEMAAQYAHFLISHTNNPNYRTNAYYCLMEYAEIYAETDNLAKYSHLRKDEDRKIRYNSVLYADASNILQSYLSNPYPYRKWNIVVVVIVCIILSSGCLLINNRKHIKRERKEKDELHAKLSHMESKQQAITEKNLQVVREKVFNNSVAFPLDSDMWKEFDKLFKNVNNLYNNLFVHLQKDFGLKEQELKLILLVLLDAPNNTIADMLGYSYKSVGAIKRYVAKKLGTQARHLKEFLIKYIASKSIIS